MGRYKATTGTGEAGGESSSWAGAISQVLDKLGISARSEPELVEIGSEIEVEVTDSVTGAQIAITTLNFGREDDNDDWADDDSTEAFDPPSLGKSAVYAQRESEGLGVLEQVMVHSGQIAATASVQAACELGLDILMAAIPAESASVLLRFGSTLRFVAARGPRADGLVGTEMPHDEGIAGVVLTRGKGLMVREAAGSNAHYREVDRQVEYHTRTVLAVPMVDQGEVIGVVELLNPFGSDDFAQWHQRAAVRVGRRIAKRIAAG